MIDRDPRSIDPSELGGESSEVLSASGIRDDSFILNVLKPHLNHELEELEGKVKKSTIRAFREYADTRDIDESELIGSFIKRYIIDGESLVRIHSESGIEISLGTFYHIFHHFGVQSFNNSDAATRAHVRSILRTPETSMDSNRSEGKVISPQETYIVTENKEDTQECELNVLNRPIPEELRSHIGHKIEELKRGHFAKKIIRRLIEYESILGLQGLSAIDYLLIEHHYDKGLRKLSDTIGISPQALKRVFGFLGIPYIDGEEGYSRVLRFAREDEDGIIRDNRGLMRWQIKENSDEENLRIGIRNVQFNFFKCFPEFNELFPRENGVIDPALEEAAKTFILERIGTQEKFTSVMGSTPCNKKLVPYFGSHLIAIVKSFEPLGIKFDEEPGEDKSLTLIGKENSVHALILVQAQGKGTVQLLKYLEAKIQIQDLKPFFIEEIPSNSNREGEFYVGVASGKVVTLRLNLEMVDILKKGNKILAFPREDQQGYYQWLDFYRVDEERVVYEEQLKGSCKIDSINRRLDTNTWLGIERQLLKDYTNDLISFDQLYAVPIKMKAKRDGGHLWKENGHSTYLYISRHFDLKEDDNLILMPEKETEEGTDFLLIKENIELARYKLDRKQKKFVCVENLIAIKQPLEQTTKEKSFSSDVADEVMGRLLR